MIDISSGLGKAQAYETAINAKGKALEATDMKGMLEMQQEMGKLQMYYGTLSSMVNNEKQIIQSIIQKM